MIPRLLALAMLAAATEAAAQSGEIVVTGRGLGAARGEEAFGAVTIDRERLANGASYRLEDVLRDVAGFQQFRRSDARSANPTSQGATLRALGGNASSRALLILDGVPQSDPFGGWIAWPALDSRRLGQIRAVRGGGAGANGPGALAGTIELTSAGLDETEGQRADLSYGSRESIDAFAGFHIPLGAGRADVSASWMSGDGFIPVVEEQRGTADRPSPYRQASVALRGLVPVGTGKELQVSALVFTDRRERGTALSEIGTSGADASLRLVGDGALPFAALAYVQLRDFRNRFAAATANRASVTQTLDQISVPATGLGARFEVRPVRGPLAMRLGADTRATEGETRELFQFVAGVPTRLRVAGGRTITLGAFAELAWEQGPLSLTAGGRLDHWQISDGRLHETLLSGGATLTDSSFPERSGWEPTGRAGAAWRVSSELVMRVAAYRGWRLPTLNELYRPFRLGTDATAANPALDPERLDGIEAGAEFHPAPAIRIAATLFANRLSGAIANVTLGTGPGVFPGVGFVAAGGQFRQRRNLDAIVSRGIELDASLRLGELQLVAGASFADPEIRASGLAFPLNGLRPAQSPRNSVHARIDWQGRSGARVSIAAHHVGDQFEDDLNRLLIEDALTIDAVAALPLADRLDLELRGENVTNARVVAGISGAGIIERATPRTLWLGLRWRG